eukprot:5638412-Alexandrium_andersonii.AAC.1
MFEWAAWLRPGERLRVGLLQFIVVGVGTMAGRAGSGQGGSATPGQGALPWESVGRLSLIHI